jgi:hypothetical protein
MGTEGTRKEILALIVGGQRGVWCKTLPFREKLK